MSLNVITLATNLIGDTRSMNKKFIEITSRGNKIKLNREGIICPQNPQNSDEAPDMEFVNVATAYIKKNYNTQKHLNHKRFTSYGLKHVYERATGNYIPNGDFIYAMHLSGFDIVQCHDLSKNCKFNISNKMPNTDTKNEKIAMEN